MCLSNMCSILKEIMASDSELNIDIYFYFIMVNYWFIMGC